MALRVNSFRCGNSDAIGGKADIRERRQRIDVTRLTRLGHWPDRNSAVQWSRSRRDVLSFGAAIQERGRQRLSLIQNDSGLTQGLADPFETG
jgi:hypothetical protein